MISPSLHMPNPGLPRGYGGVETSPLAGGTPTLQPLPPPPDTSPAFLFN